MALGASVAMTGVAIALLCVYAADVAVATAADEEHGFLPLDHMQRGMGLGGPALVLPIIAFFVSLRDPSRGLGVMIVISGALIVIGGLVVAADPPTDGESDPAAMTAMLFAPAAVQLALGGIKIARS